VHINRVIGDLPLERLNVGHVEAVLAAVPGAAGTRHRVLATLRAALNAAVKQRQITWNPCTGIEVEPYILRPSGPEADPLYSHKGRIRGHRRSSDVVVGRVGLEPTTGRL
jgi:hypothetical protein